MAPEFLSCGPAEAANVKKHELIRKREILGQDPVTRKGAFRIRQQRLVRCKSDRLDRFVGRDNYRIRQLQLNIRKSLLQAGSERRFFCPDLNIYRMIKNDLVESKDELRIAVDIKSDLVYRFACTGRL